MSWTPGPWRAGYADGSSPESIVTVARIDDGHPRGVAKTVWGCGCCESTADAEDIANAHLIAAAPALYWACVRAEERWLPCSHSPACNIEADDMDELCEDCDDRRMLREAIKQARGKP